MFNPQNHRIMKNLKTTIKKFLIFFLTGLVILLFNNCKDLTENEIMLSDSASDEQLISWNELLDQVDLKSEIAFVQNGESIQEAVDAALPGEVIYIEPGIYPEDLTLNKSDVRLIGLSLEPNDLVINNGKESNIEILKLYDQKSLDNFQKRSGNRGKRNRISGFSRTEIAEGIAHYQFKVRMGPGEFDVVRIHRVVRENSPFHPVLTNGHVFMVHGAFTGFEGTFLKTGLLEGEINATNSAPVYLATQNIDVWGIDMGWTMVPNDETLDFKFMKNWGYKKDADHTRKAMCIARMVRGFSGQGFSGINLLGFSSGNTVAYAAADRETQKQNWRKRHIKGLISVDNAFKIENGEDSGCASAQTVADQIAGGIFENTNGQFFQTLGFLALEYPNVVSPIFNDGSTTNIQAFRLVFAIDAFGFGFHFFGGDFSGLYYSDEERAIRVVANYSHYMPNLLWQEIDAVNCSSMNVNFDNHLNKISVPIFHIGANGGNGESGNYTGTLTASTDLTNYLVSASGVAATDFGHADNWVGQDAGPLMWSKLDSWIKSHH